jgi:hypothetical protein
MKKKSGFNEAQMRKLLKQLKTTPELLKRDTQSLMKQMAGQVAVECANATNPPFIAESGVPVAGFKKRITKDVSRAHPSFNDVFQNISNSIGTTKAKQFWAIYNQKSKAEAMAFLAANGVAIRAGSFSPAHVEAQRGKKGYVKPNAAETVIPDEELDKKQAYIERKQGYVGLQKSGWFAAVDHITRSRAGGKATEWLRKLAKQTSGTGTVTETAKGTTMRLVNNSPHAEEALNDRLIYSVPGRVAERFKKSMDKILQAQANKLK